MKKFTDSEKWRDPWFRSLGIQAKTLWIFLLDEVDNAGVWELDEDYFQYATGIRKTLSDILRQLGDRVVFLPDKSHVLVPKYCFFQQGGILTENKPAHRRIFQLLEKYDLEQDAKGKLCHGNAIAMPYECHTNGINIGIGIGIGKEEGSVRGETNDFPNELDHLGFVKLWDDWLDYRRERKLPKYKSRSIKTQFNRLARWVTTHGMEAVMETMRTSIANQYKGLFEPRRRLSNHSPLIKDRDYDNAT